MCPINYFFIARSLVLSSVWIESHTFAMVWVMGIERRGVWLLGEWRKERTTRIIVCNTQNQFWPKFYFFSINVAFLMMGMGCWTVIAIIIGEEPTCHWQSAEFYHAIFSNATKCLRQRSSFVFIRITVIIIAVVDVVQCRTQLSTMLLTCL